MQQHDIASPEPVAQASGLGAVRDGLIMRAAGSLAGSCETGRLCLTLPSGRSGVLGSNETTVADLSLRSLAVVSRMLRRGTLGFAESYIDGSVTTTDLGRLLRYFLDNYEQLSRKGGRFLKPGVFDKIAHRLRRNTRSGSRRNISAHYDLGNEFYSLWLDEGMTYSSAVYRSPDMTLEAAQEEKYKSVVSALQLQPGDRLLEIGCGWGGMALAAARHGAKVTAITISAEQLNYARSRLAEQAPDAGAEIRFQDYRDTGGTYDKLVSVEMIEAVGEEHWPQYFSTVSKRLKPGGTCVIQAITIREEDFQSYRRTPDFIQRYIFPGGMLPTVSIMSEQARRVGLSFETVEQFGHDYARTLVEWRKRFADAWPSIASLGFDEKFRRMWEFYLTYCEAGFERRVIDVGFYRMVKPLGESSGVPQVA